jgi:hypothetical protein
MVNDPERDDLDTLFAAARDDMPSADLQARVLDEAAAVQAAQALPRPASPRGGGLLASLAAALGGWPGLSGVTAAGVIGLGLGFYAPDLVDSLSAGQVWSVGGGAGVTPDIGGLWTEIGDV